tara:strand:+ start:422 stop:565 length:144 start_codon:yes stop_codon:yes gene_type:complete
MKPLSIEICSFERFSNKYDIYILSPAPLGNAIAWIYKNLWEKIIEDK